MTMIDIIFYAVFISQIVLISYYYPKKIYNRNVYVLRTYPAPEYPKLYQHSKYVAPVGVLSKRMRQYLFVNIGITIFGFSLLLAMAIKGYLPSHIKQNQDLIFILFFFLLQSIPHALLEISTHNWYKHMRNAAKSDKRKADLSPRRLFDFISPLSLVIAVLAFMGWATYYLYNKGFSTPWEWQSYMTFIVMAGLNLLYICLGYHYLRGKKLDPHQSSEHQHQLIKTNLRVLIFASIIMSLMLVTSDAINQNQWDKFEPISMSLYFQIVIIFGIGEIFRSVKIENINFDVYKEDPWLV